MLNQIVARYQNGSVLKGFTTDFRADKETFHVTAGGTLGEKPAEVRLADLKAVFFVKDFAGRPEYNEVKAFDTARPLSGRKIRVVFTDGEEMVGVTQGYQPDRPGFFVTPADPGSNNLRCFVVSSAVREAKLL
jgi:hypothetical protein